jgi:hypothetical protein
MGKRESVEALDTVREFLWRGIFETWRVYVHACLIHGHSRSLDVCDREDLRCGLHCVDV